MTGFPDGDLLKIGKRFDDLEKNMRGKFARRGIRRGATVVRDAVRRRAEAIDDPSTDTKIAKNIVVQSSRRNSGKGQVGVRVGILGGARKYANTRENIRSGKAGKVYKTAGDKSNPGGDTWYWRFIEFGRGRVVAKKKQLANRRSSGVQFFGDEVRPAKAQPFMRPGFAESVEPATAATAASISADLDNMFRGVK